MKKQKSLVRINFTLECVEIADDTPYPIKINTKYYSAEVEILFKNYALSTQEEIEASVKGLNVIIYFFQGTDEIDAYLKHVLTLANRLEVEMSLLVSYAILHTKDQLNGV